MRVHTHTHTHTIPLAQENSHSLSPPQHSPLTPQSHSRKQAWGHKDTQPLRPAPRAAAWGPPLSPSAGLEGNCYSRPSAGGASHPLISGALPGRVVGKWQGAPLPVASVSLRGSSERRKFASVLKYHPLWMCAAGWALEDQQQWLLCPRWRWLLFGPGFSQAILLLEVSGLNFPDSRCPWQRWPCQKPTAACFTVHLHIFVCKAGKSTHFLWGSSLLHPPAHLFSTLLAVLWPHHTHCLTNFQGYFQVHSRCASPKGFILLPLSRKTADRLVQVTLIWQSDGGNYPNTAFRFHKQSLKQPPRRPSRTRLPEVSAAPGIRHNNQQGL